MLIGELAHRSGLSTKTLRFYETIGVLPPPARTANGYRDYDATILDRLGFIRSAQAAGFTLAEIRHIIDIRDHGAAPCSHVTELLAAKAAHTRQQIRDLQRLLDQLKRLQIAGAAVDAAVCEPHQICTILSPSPHR